MKSFSIVLSLSCFVFCVAIDPYNGLALYNIENFELPVLHFQKDALEPYIDAATIQAHYNGHHQTYTTKTNAVIKTWREQDKFTLSTSSLIDIMKDIKHVPEQFKTDVRNQVGGYVNHCFYWACLSPSTSSAARQPQGQLATDINHTFGGLEHFKEQFDKAAATLFGSGYVWLVRDSSANLQIISTSQQDCPLSQLLYPIICLDVWEHAYYLKHQYRRPAYIQQWWEVMDWSLVEALDEWWVQQGQVTYRRKEL